MRNELIKMNPRKKPKFIRQSGQEYVRLGNKWRRPRGVHSKLKIKERGKGFIPNPGYGAPRQLRFKHPSGLYEVLVHNLAELQKLDAKMQAARIAASVGRKKKADIMKKAEELRIKILNPARIVAKVKEKEQEGKRQEERKQEGKKEEQRKEKVEAK